MQNGGTKGLSFPQNTVNAKERLEEEHKAWLKSHPRDFRIDLDTNTDGSTNYFKWKCAIPGKPKTPWEGGRYRLEMDFPSDYPYSPPHCHFCPTILHPNVFPSGTVALSLISKQGGWRPQTTAKEILLGIQLLLDDPNFHDPAQAEAYVIYSQSRLDYDQRIREQAKRMAAN